MVTPLKRATVYFEPETHKLLRLKAAENDVTLSELVNRAVRLALAEDAEDLIDIERRAKERPVSFAEAVKRMKRAGRL